MLSRLAQGVNSVLQELSGEEAAEGEPQDGVIPSVPTEDVTLPPESWGAEEEVLERLAHTEQLVVQLKEIIRERDTKLQSTETLLKEERAAADARLSKLKLQAKAKVAALTKQLEQMRGQDSSQEELEQLRLRLQEEESATRALREQLKESEQHLREKEETHAEQLRVLQSVVCEKDVCFEEQVRKHEEELLGAARGPPPEPELQRALQAAKEHQDALRARTQELQLLQEEILSADQQKQILTAQFRQMEAQLAEAGRQQEEERQHWAMEAERTKAELTAMRDRLEAAERERDEEVTREREVAAKHVAELCFLKERLESAERERDETVSREGEEAARMQAELLSLRDKLEATERESNKSVVREPNKEEELSSLKERLETAERERDEAVMREREEIARMDGELNAPKERLEAAERLGAEGEAEERERKEEDSGWEAEIAALKEHLEMAERERDEAKTREREEATRREEELRGLRERMEEMERERDENATSLSFLMPEREREEELSTLRERLEEAEGEREKAEQRAEALADVWRGLSTLMGLPQRERDEGEEGEEASLPTDPALCVSALQGALRALESRLAMMREERQESEARCFQLSFTLEAVQGELCKSTAEVEEAVTRIRQLEQQIATQQVPNMTLGEPDTPQERQMADGEIKEDGEPSEDVSDGQMALQTDAPSHTVQDLADISIVSVLERRLVEQEEELVSLRSQLAVAKGLNTGWKKEYKKGEVEGTGGTENTAEGSTDQRDASTERQDSAAQNKESSIVSANLQSKRVKEEEDTVSGSEVLSANTEVLQTTDLQLEVTVQRSSSGLDKICSMEESVAQAKGEMAVSMVLLERSKSWEGGDSKTCLTESRTVSSSSFSSSSVVTVLQERSTKAWDHQGALLQASDSQELMGELKVRCEELRVVLQQREEELQSLREVAMESQRRAHEVELQLDTARAELSHTAQCRNSALESQQLESGVLEEQLHSLHTESRSKDLKIQALQTDLDHAQHCLAEQEGQGHVLLAQLEEKKRAILEVERRLSEAEARVQELSLEISSNDASLTKSSDEVEELRQQLQQKEQEIQELGEGMSCKLVEAGEERFALAEVKRLKKQLEEMEKACVERETEKEGKKEERQQELQELRKDREVLGTQVEAMRKEGEQLKRKLQAALVHRKELLKKIEGMEGERERSKEGGGGGKTEKEKKEKEDELQSLARERKREHEKEREEKMLILEAALEEARQALRVRDALLDSLQVRVNEQDRVLAHTTSANQNQDAGIQTEDPKPPGNPEEEMEKTELDIRLASLESERETLQKKLQEALTSRKDTIRKAQEKDRHHREQLKQQKEEYSELLERCKEQGREKQGLLLQLRELEEMQAGQQGRRGDHMREEPERAGGDWGQESWVDFAGPEMEQQAKQQMSSTDKPFLKPETATAAVTVEEETEEARQVLKGEVRAEQEARMELEKCLTLREAELQELHKEMQSLRDNERQIDALSGEIEVLRKQCQQAEAHAEALRVEMEARGGSGGGSGPGFEPSIVGLQAEVEEFKLFLNRKNEEISDLGRHLCEQNTVLQLMQETVSEKDQLIASLQQSLMAEEENRQKLEAEIPLKQQEEEAAESAERLQQLQRKLQAALFSRKEALKENKALKEQVAAAERDRLDQRGRLEACETELRKLREEREKLIQEVDRTLLENQSLGDSCESLKLAMDGVLAEKNSLEKEATSVRERANQEIADSVEKLRGLQEEYETLLRSYENVSDEAERVRRVLEAARQERQELVARVRSQEVARREAEERTEEARQEVETVKDKMRKFAKSKQQKILELEEENHQLREREERAKERAVKVQKGERQEDMEEESRALERAREELESLAAELEHVKTQRDLQEQEAAELRQKLAEEHEQGELPSQDGTFITAAQQNRTVSTLTPSPDRQGPPDSREHTDQTDSMERPLPDSTGQQPKMDDKEGETSERQKDTRDGLKEESEEAVRLKQGVALADQLVFLEQQLHESQKQVERQQMEAEQWESELRKAKAQLQALEAEKDDLEEQLMDQLAQLNGSIAAYQQEAAESAERLAELERETERLGRESKEWQAQAERETERAIRLEEDRRQAQRERAEAEAEIGSKRELQEKLRSAQRGREGSQSHAKQLQELLREKQMEVRQLQRDSIQYQERISSLEKETKALQLSGDEARQQLEAAHREVKKASEERTRVEAELSTYKVRLDDAQSEAGRALAEKRAFEERVRHQEDEAKAEAEKRLETERQQLQMELRKTQQGLEEVLRELEREKVAVKKARTEVEGKEGQVRQLQGRLDEALSGLAAFSHSMSSLQDDRDRVLDEAKLWESRFHSTLQGKEAEVQGAEARVKELVEQLQSEMAQKQELQGSVDRLQQSEAELQHHLEETEARHMEAAARLEGEIAELKKSLVQMEGALVEAREELASVRVEEEGLRQRTQALEDAVSDLQHEADALRVELREHEAGERSLGLNIEQLEADLRVSKALTEQLQVELAEKEKREVELLEEKEQAVSQATEEARQEAEARAHEAEREVAVWRDEARRLEEKARKAEEDCSLSKAQLEAFTKAMGSLQDDRDRVLGEYKQLEERHLQVMVEKDSVIQEAATENNSLKGELRSLLSQRDDLNAEKAKLSAELHGYRDELTQVLSMKDSQSKQLLSAQLERIRAMERDLEEMIVRVKELEREREEMEGKVKRLNEEREEMVVRVKELEREREEMEGRERGRQEMEERVREREEMECQLRDLESRIEELEREKEEMEGTITTLEQGKQEAEGSVQELEQARGKSDGLERKETETDNWIKRKTLSQTGSTRLGSGESEREGEIWRLREELCQAQGRAEYLERELGLGAGVLRTEAETAQERVAELSRDLVQLEQSLLVAREEAAKLREQNHSFAGAMASLQTTRDQALEETQALQRRLKELEQHHSPTLPSSPPGRASGEVQSLRNALAALQSDRERMLEELQQWRAECARFAEEAGELARVNQELQEEERRRAEESREREDRMERERQELEERPERERQELEERPERERQELEERPERERQELEKRTERGRMEKEEHLERDRQAEQQELKKLREESVHWQSQAELRQQQFLSALTDKEQQLHDLATLLQEARRPAKVSQEHYQREASPGADLCGEALASELCILQAESGQLKDQLDNSLKELHMKELKIQQLNSMLSQVFEEKRSVSAQLRGSAQRLNEAQSRCGALQRQLQELQDDKNKGCPEIDSAPGAPQEHSPTPGEGDRACIKELEHRLVEEQEQRQAVEEQLCAVEEQLRRYTLGEWMSLQDGESQEHVVLIEPPEGAVTRTRSVNPGLCRKLRALFCSRQRTPLVASLYLLTVHLLLLLCMGGYL
ncbi:golgin subfamily B member 1 isoform X2 [Amia ocellicauda]|uniref:golgin subfamily B member 1 isoform X2 n=1 Tax=Amia ocellicauda TaxID=2972642 RepID=UPI00346418AE